jgi:hypothetical protein
MFCLTGGACAGRGLGVDVGVGVGIAEEVWELEKRRQQGCNLGIC